MRLTRSMKRMVAVAALIGLAPLAGCHLELAESGLKVVCDSNDYVLDESGWDVYYRPVNPVVGIFCPGYYPGL